jgi:hypothetical protein
MPPSRSRSTKPLALKAQDVVVAARLALGVGEAWTYERLAHELGMSSQTVFQAIQRLAAARLVNPIRRRLARQEFLEFVEHGLRYAFPAQPGVARVAGMPTGISAPPLSRKILSGDDASVVWPSRNGDAVGWRVAPLHRRAPEAARKNPRLYEMLALLDAMRLGGAREREVAAREIRARLT